MNRSVLIAAFVVMALVACGGTMDGPWGICARHHDRASCTDDGCVWHVAPTPDAVCNLPVGEFTPLENDGCFKDTFSPWRDDIPGCRSDDECPAGTQCVAKSFLYGVVPTCDYAMLCVTR